jgi:hypothetical protein
MRSPGRLAAEETLREIRDRLHGIARTASGPRASVEEQRAQLDEIDRLLSSVAEELRGLAESIGFSQFRATLPGMRQRRPQEVAALLDLCLEDPQGRGRTLHLIDYITTLLSTDSHGTDRTLIADPVHATPMLRALCESVTGYDPSEIEGHLERLDAAIAELHRAESIEPVVRRTRGYKAELGRLFFVPDVLRKIVEYNIAVSNRIEDLLVAERTLAELDADNSLPELGEALASAREETPHPETKGGIPSESEEVETIRSIGRALVRRLQGARTEKSIVGALAAMLEISILNPKEREALVGGSGDPEDALAMSVIVGLLARKLSEVGPLLADLPLTPARITQGWVPSLDTKLQRVIADCLRRNDYPEAKALSQTRAKLLQRTLEAQRVAAVRAVAPPSKAPARAAPIETSRAAPPRRAAPQPAGLAAERGKRGRKLQRALLGVAALAALAVSVLSLLTARPSPRSVRVLDTASVATLSPYLESAYRDGLGFGRSFFGTLNDRWRALEDRARAREALRIAETLGKDGVQQIMLFDRRRALRVHWVGGRLLLPLAPEE